MKRACAIMFAIIFISCTMSVVAFADEAETAAIISDFSLLCDGSTNAALTDDSIYTYSAAETIEITSEDDIYGIYIKFDKEPEAWKLNANGNASVQGEHRYLHQYVPIDGCKQLVLDFAEGTVVADIYLFGAGQLPNWVHVWETAEYADIMICPTHSDDDQLFFAGMLPWCAAKGYAVQIVYLTNHLDTHDRPHELLEGIWHCGIRYYPYISKFPDLYAQGLEQAEANYKAYGYDKQCFVEFYVEAINRFKPLVVAGHDINGEYGHGVHMLSFHTLTEAVEAAADRGVWDVPKTYIHLWGENRVTFNWDEPLDFFDGKTAFEISQEGYSYHKSQHRFTGLSNWLYGTEYAPITKASQIRGNSPCSFGLYRSTVGVDTSENGIFENLVSYGDAKAAKEKEQLMLKKAITDLREKTEPYTPKYIKRPIPSTETEKDISEEASAPQMQEHISAVTNYTSPKSKAADLSVFIGIAALVCASAIMCSIYHSGKGKRNERNNKEK